MKSLGVYMSLRGNLDWIPRRHSMFSGAYATAADTDQQCNNENPNRYKLHTFQMILIGHSLTKNFYLSRSMCLFIFMRFMRYYRNRNQRQKQNNWITLCFNEKKMVKDKDKNIPRPSPESVLHL